jgi:hypothetical protein
MTLKKQAGIFVSLVSLMSAVMSLGIESAENCRQCHSNAYTEWKASRHAASSASENALYAAMLKWSQDSKEPNSGRECYECHEPVRTLDTGGSSVDGLAAEGVTCDLCHGTKIVGKGKDKWFAPVQSKKKYGPLEDAVSSDHPCEYSSIFDKAEFCLTCHGDSQNAHGVAFCSTEKEWQKTEFARRNVTCQDCHMPAREGKAAPLGKMRDKIHSHEFLGGYSTDLLNDCADIRLELSGEGKRKKLKVEITNNTVGHALPTGSPMRMVVLSIVAKDSSQRPVWKNWNVNPLQEDSEAVFMRLLEDKNGNAPAPPWESVTQRFDQRLFPGKPVSLEYELSESNAVYLEASLVYYLAPAALLQKLGIHNELYRTPKTITSVSIRL